MKRISHTNAFASFSRKRFFSSPTSPKGGVSFLAFALAMSVSAASHAGLLNVKSEISLIANTDTHAKVSAEERQNTAIGAFPAQANDRPTEWLSHGRDYKEQRFSPLNKINDKNVKNLGLTWAYDLGVSRGIEATPLVIDGVMYVTGTWNLVHALDAKTGEWLWTYDPEVDRGRARYLCCDAVNRGLAVWEDKLFMGTIDGRLIALDIKTGQEIWDVITIDTSKPYTTTGAPRVVKGNVLIGNGGAEYGARGYISAYDAENGSQVWRFYTVPGNPENGFENEAMKEAAKTWKGEWWQYGGGGTVWDSMAYDPELDLLYIGVGNGSPWNQAIRSPGGGDNLYLSSIVALKPETGEYVWHYQTTPGETWDYTATQHIILAEMEIGGSVRKVLMQAPKNGFFYVLDRETGKLISAENYVPVTWASHIDKTTGRPVENSNVRWGDGKPTFTLPGPFGGHNWQPMSYSPQTGLVYIPAMETPHIYAEDKDFTFTDGIWNTGSDMMLASLPTSKAQLKAVKAMVKGRLLAWNPITQKAVWQEEHKGTWNGGVLSTAGNLVIQGNSEAEVVAYNAKTGKRLWSFFAQTGVVAPPISYEIDGEQYITVAAGWGGAFALTYGGVAPASHQIPAGRVLTFKLGGEASLPEAQAMPATDRVPPMQSASPETVAKGHALYTANCMACHGDHAQSASTIPNLRYTPLLGSSEAWSSVVIDGVLNERGMPKFSAQISKEEAEAIRAYIIFEARSGRDGKFYKGGE